MAAKRKRVTLNEFKAWLDGVEELQPVDWTPSVDQWKLIRAKISNIREPTPQVEQLQVAPMSYRPVEPQPTLPHGMVPPPPVGGLPSGAVVDMSPEAKAMLTRSPGDKSTTPNIDTADGAYQSSFN